MSKASHLHGHGEGSISELSSWDIPCSPCQPKEILEDVGDNLFNPDPYYQQGGDMVRVGGMGYHFEINNKIVILFIKNVSGCPPPIAEPKLNKAKKQTNIPNKKLEIL